MDDSFISQKKYEAYLDALRRFRWSVLTTIIISSLVVAHLYLENGLTQAQLQSVSMRKLTGVKERERSELKAKLLDFQKKNPKEKLPQELLNSYVALDVSLQRGDNMYRDARVPERTLPLLLMNVPGNDFVVVLAIMLAIFCVSTWLNSRAVLAPLEKLTADMDASQHFRDLVRLNFLFTGASDDSDWLANILQYVVVWLPFLSLSLGAFIDLRPIVVQIAGDQSFANAGPVMALLSRFVTFACLLIVIGGAAVGTCYKLNAIDQLMRGEERPHAEGV
jgi:hypothetical protein